MINKFDHLLHIDATLQYNYPQKILKNILLDVFIIIFA